MAGNRYDYNERSRRRREYQARRRRRRQMNHLLLAAAVLLVGGLVLFLSLWGDRQQPEEPPVEENQSGEDVPMPGENENKPMPGEGMVVTDPKDDWSLVLVNRWNPLPENYQVTLATIPNGLEVDERCYDDLMDMLDALYDMGLIPVVCSAHRSVSLQQSLYDNMVEEFVSRGYARAEAETLAAKEVALPGTSEHHLGLAVDIVDWDYQLLDEGQEDTAVQKWLLANSWRYGFILRYPTEKTNVTGIIYEPWHYRYVGKERAKQIYDSGLCLEEWLATP